MKRENAFLGNKMRIKTMSLNISKIRTRNKLRLKEQETKSTYLSLEKCYDHHSNVKEHGVLKETQRNC